MRRFFRLRVIPGEEPSCELSAVNTPSCWKNGYLSLLEGGSRWCTFVFTIAQSMWKHALLPVCPIWENPTSIVVSPFPGKNYKIKSGEFPGSSKDFPVGSDGKESAYNVEDLCLIAGSGGSPGEENGKSL